jgi:hypothetical protein
MMKMGAHPYLRHILKHARKDRGKMMICHNIPPISPFFVREESHALYPIVPDKRYSTCLFLTSFVRIWSS